MASWYRTKSKGRTYVKVYARDKSGLVKPLPQETITQLRGGTLHNLEDHDVEAWVQWFEKNYEEPERNLTHIHNPELRRYVDRYVEHMAAESGKHQKTASDHKRYIHKFVLPFFTDHEPYYPNPIDWPEKSNLLKPYLLEVRKASPEIALKVYSALRGFWRYLCREEKIIRYQTELILRDIKRTHGQTPLKTRISPEDCLAYAEKMLKNDKTKPLGYIALLAYFFALRPQEIFALTRQDFIAGKLTGEIAIAKDFERNGLYAKLCVLVHRQRFQPETHNSKAVYPATGNPFPGQPYPAGFGPPKGSSPGDGGRKIRWLPCYDRRAALLLAPLLKENPQTETSSSLSAVAKKTAEDKSMAIKKRKRRGNRFVRRNQLDYSLIFPEINDTWFRRWDKDGYKHPAKDSEEADLTVTIKDLRRASILWLGKTKALNPIVLKDFSRHEKWETLEKYLRDPAQEFIDSEERLDLDDL